MSQNVLVVSLIIVFFHQLRFNEISGFECGTTDFIESKALNGTQTVRNAWPFLVALFHIEQSEFFCGGTLISAKNILTAANCIQTKYSERKLAPEDVAVFLGAYNLNVKAERGAQQRDVDEICVHPEWKVDNDRYDADLAILVLSEIVEFTKYIRPICMPDDDPPIDNIGSIVGWGRSFINKTSKHELVPHQTFTRVLNDSYCYTSMPVLASISSNRTFCCGDGEGAPNTGDAGGGFFIGSGSAWIQYGIISVSLTDATGNIATDSLSLYTNIRSFKQWIDDTVKQSGSAVMTLNGKIGIDITCTYEIIPNTAYKCSSWEVNVRNEDYEIEIFSGNHLPGYASQNVSQIWFWTGTLEYIPHGIGRKFPYLDVFRVGFHDRNLKLKLLKRSNFEDMPLLSYLDVGYNNLETIDEDTFRDLSHLQTLNINNNKLKTLQKNIFQRNLRLKSVNANSNDLEFLHDDLFKNNALLERATFKDNKLQMISTVFTHLNFIWEIDFHGNDCIDKAFDGVGNLTEFQDFIFSECKWVIQARML